MNFLRRQWARLCSLGYVRDILALRRNARLYLLSVVLNGLGNSVFMLFFNLYVVSLGESRGFLGSLQSLGSAITLIVGIPVGILGDRMGRRRALLIGGSVGLMGTWAFLAMPNQPMMVFWWTVQGLANTLYWININPFLMQNSSEQERALLFSANFGLAPLAGFVGSLVAGGLPAALAGRMGVGPESAEAYRAAMYIGLSLNLVALVPIWLIREVRWPGPRTTPPPSLKSVFHLKAPVLKLLLPQLVIGFGAALLIPYLNLFFKDRFPISDQTLGTIFAPSQLITAIASLAGPALALRLGKIRSVAFTQAASLGFLLVLGFVPALPIAAMSFWLRGALMNMGQPLYFAFCMEQSPKEEQGTVNSFVNMAWQVGWVVGPVISGVVQERVGFTPLFIATGTFYAVSTVLTYAFFKDVDPAPARAGTATPA